jgi:predicted component of viral defense system (DUF524 family)
VTACEAIEIAVVDRAKNVQAKLNLALLPNHKSYKQIVSPLIKIDHHLESDSVPPVQLLESCEYHYEFIGLTGELGEITTSHPDVFESDTKDGHSGRVRPGLYTGTLPIKVYLEGNDLGSFSLEVRSRKLGYLSEYQWMVRDLAEQMSEVVMNRFAPAIQQFSIDNTRDAKTLYQRFVFLKSLISGEDFQAAISEIVRRPHVAWMDYHEPVHPSKGIKAGSNVSRQLAKAGPRSPWAHGVIDSIPLIINRHRTEVTVDTTPNRFVKFALEQWRDVVARIAEILGKQSANPAIDRGLREVAEVRDYLDSVLAEGLFRELGVIDGYPADNQVLHKREGYRDIFQAYIQFDVAAKLSWDGGEDVYGAGKRDVATLYEYWVFMKLAQLISELCDIPFEFTDLIEVEKEGLNIKLKKGRRCVLRGIVERHGRKLALEFWFNRTFSNNIDNDGSWSHQMRPDYSLKISPADDEVASFDPVFVHFDAKYRIQHLYELFGNSENEEAANDSNEESISTLITGPKRDDLLKMHAYRDAIRRSAGAYVLYPGTEKKEFRQYHELLPGLGAFALRPTETGEAEGKLPLARFIEDMLVHIASQITQHERERYWVKEAYADQEQFSSVTPAASFLNYPPADTQVLLGYVKNKKHWEWMEKNKLYNVRGYGKRGKIELGTKELASDIILLSCPSENKAAIARIIGSPELHTKEEMVENNYPDPKGIYYCFNLEIITNKNWSEHISSELIEMIRSEFTKIKAPVVISWFKLVKKIDRV